MRKEKKLIPMKLQSYLCLFPYLGMPIAIFTGFYNIYITKRSIVYVLLYYLITLIPLIIFGGAAGLVLKIFILGHDVKFVLIATLILFYVVALCIALACIGFERRFIVESGG